MISLWQQLLQPAYLFATDPGPLGRWGAVYVLWAALLLGGAAVAAWQYRRCRCGTLQMITAACVIGLIFLLLRLVSPHIHNIYPHLNFMLIDAWTARIWPLSATGVALLAGLLWHLERVTWPPFLRRHILALAGRVEPDGAPMSLLETLLMLLAHLSGLAWLWHTAQRPLWWAIPSLLALVALPLLRRPRRLRLETLTPLFLSYAASLISSYLSQKLDILVQDYQAFALPDLWSPWFNVPAMIVVGLSYTLWLQIRWLLAETHESEPSRWEGRAVLIAFSVALGVWFLAVVVVHRTRGVTASDPYCYVQMAVDLARSGSPLHHFPLAGLAAELGLPTWPTVHIGYHPPIRDNLSPTMWPIGWPLLMAPLYWLGGLETLYWAAPLMAALSLIVTWLLGNEIWRDEPPSRRWSAAALACLLLATSPEGSERMLVPMADAAAQFFTLLTLWMLIQGVRSRSFWHWGLAGAGMGMAFFIRHPQLPLAAAALVAISLTPASLRRRLSLLAVFGLVTLVVILPDLFYHRLVFGDWLHPESTEGFLMSIRHIGNSFLTLLQHSLLRRAEWGFVLPCILYGSLKLWKNHRTATLIGGSGLLAVLVLHLCYAALRPRDLIAVFPLLALAAAWGCITWWVRWSSRPGPTTALLVCTGLVLVAARSYDVLSIPWRNNVITFGHVHARQLEALRELERLTPEHAVIGSMLNGGAIELHAHRSTVHPTPWTADELRIWIDSLQKQNRPFYLLDDGEEMPPLLEQQRQIRSVQWIAQLDLPYFAHGGGNLPRQAQLYLLLP